MGLSDSKCYARKKVKMSCSLVVTMCIMLIMNTRDQENLIICQPMRGKRVQNSGPEDCSNRVPKSCNKNSYGIESSS